MKNLIYCYDAYCGWCYGFSPVIKQMAATFQDRLAVEVLSGGMVLPEQPVSIAATAPYIQEAYKAVEAHSGVTFGADYLWHIFHPEQSDWFPDSLLPAIALCVIKSQHPDQALNFAADIQYALHFEGRDLTDPEAYRHLLPKYGLSPEVFYTELADPAFEDKARYDFSLVKQLQVHSFPTVLLQTSAQKFYLVAKGYTDYDTLEERIDRILNIGKETP